MESHRPTDPLFYDLEYYLSLEYRYFSHAHRSRVKAILDCLGEIKNKTILDLGGGAGYLAYEMQKRGAVVTVIDFAEAAISWGKERFPSLEFKLLSLEQIESLNCHFDVVTAFDLIEHLEEPKTLLEKVKQAIKPEGLFFLSTDNKQSLFLQSNLMKRLEYYLSFVGPEGHDYRMIKEVEKYRREVLGKDYHQSHLRSFSPTELRGLLEKNDWRIESFKTYHLWSNFIKRAVGKVFGPESGAGMIFCCRLGN